jgi:hypothetical protein
MSDRDGRQTWDEAEQPDPLEPCVGNPAYEAHIEKVVSIAVGADKFSYLQTNLAIIIDRDQRHREGFRKPRMVATLEDLEVLPPGSIILDDLSVLLRKDKKRNQYSAMGATGLFSPLVVQLPATVLHEPTP